MVILSEDSFKKIIFFFLNWWYKVNDNLKKYASPYCKNTQ